MGRSRKRKHKRAARRAAEARASQVSAAAPSLPSAAGPQPFLARWGWLIVLLLAVLLRALYFLDHRLSPFFHGLVLDSANYDAMAWALVNGEGFEDGVFTFNPLGPLILAAIYSVGGHDVAWPRYILLGLDALAVLGVYGLTRRLSGWQAALGAGLLAAAYRPAIFYAGELLAEGWVLVFAVGGLLALVWLRERWWGLLLAGLGLGLATLGRPNLLLFFPALLLWWAWELRAVQALLRRAAPMLLGVVLVIGPFTARNLIVGQDLVMVTAHGGVNLFIGNNPSASGWFHIPRGTGLSGGQESLIESASHIAEKRSEGPLRPSEVSRFWQGKAVEFVFDDPAAAFGLMARKAFFYVNAYEKPMVANVHYARERSVVLRYGTVGYGLVLLLGIVGMVEAWPRRREWAPLYLFVLTYSVGVVLFFVSMRYRLPVVAGLLPFAGHGAASLVRLAHSDRPKLAMWGLGLVAMGIVVLWPAVQEAEAAKDRAHTHYYLGQLAFDEDELAKAAHHFSEALGALPDNARYKYKLARVYIEDERKAEAVALLEEVISTEPIFLPPYLTLGTLYRSQGEQSEAERVLRQCVRYGPRYHYGWNNLGNVLMDLNKLEDAEAAYRQAVTASPMFIPGYQGLDRALTAQGRRAALRPVLEQAQVEGLRHYWVEQTLADLDE